MEEYNVSKEQYDAIAEIIHSDNSPVGINAKKTHILILAKLQEIDNRLQAIEKKIVSGN